MRPKFTELENLREKMNAKKVRWKKEFDWVSISICDNDYLEVDGERVALYIRNHDKSFEYALKNKDVISKEEFITDPTHLNKIHLFNCGTIKNAKSLEDFFVAESEYGLFIIELEREEIMVKLNLCQNCLSRIKKSKNYSAENFDFTKFFESNF